MINENEIVSGIFGTYKITSLLENGVSCLQNSRGMIVKAYEMAVIKDR